MKREYVIGLDLGTTSIKAVLFTTTGTPLKEAEEPVTTVHPSQIFAEQDPNEVEFKALKVLRDLLQELDIKQNTLVGIGISSAMHSLVLVDNDFNAICNMLIWSDARSKKQADALLKQQGQEIYKVTGTPIHPMTPLLKLMWMKEANFEGYLKATYFMTIKDFLISRWYGKRIIDYGMASSTGLLNLKNLDWDKECLKLAGIKKEQLSEIVPPTCLLTDMKSNLREELSLDYDIPVAIGSSDGLLANLGSGAILPGEINVSVGTSGAIRQFASGFPVNDKMETFTYVFDEKTSVIGGPTNNGGIVLDWLKEVLEFKGGIDEFIKGAESVPVGADGLVFHPYVNGERAPLWTLEAKGNLFGLGLRHRREHIARAALEGITFNIYRIGKALDRMVGKPTKITVNGGLARSSLWVQIMADVFGQEVYISETHNNAAWGAAFTALVATGKAKKFVEIKNNLPKEVVVTPNEENIGLYKELYEKYLRLGQILEDHF